MKMYGPGVRQYYQENKKRGSTILGDTRKGDNMSKLKIVSMVEIDGKRYRQEDIPPEEFEAIVEKVIERAMNNIGFVRVKKEE